MGIWNNAVYRITKPGSNCESDSELMRPESIEEFDAVAFLIQTHHLDGTTTWYNLGSLFQTNQEISNL